MSLLLLSVLTSAGCAPIGTVRLRAVDAVSGEPVPLAQVERQVPMYQPHIPLCFPVPCYFSNAMCQRQPVNTEGQADFERAATDQRFLITAPGYDPVLVERVVPWVTAENWKTSEGVSANRRGGVITVSLPRASEPEEETPDAP